MEYNNTDKENEIIDVDNEVENKKQKKTYKLLPEEQEVHITFNDMSENARMYTSIKKWIKKLDKLCAELPDVFKCIKRDDVSATYEFPSKNVSIRKGNPKIELSEEERIRRSEQMKNKK